MEARRDKQAGSALGALLGRRGSADQDAAGRLLLLTFLRLHALAALSFDLDRGAAVHGDDAVAEPSTGDKALAPDLARGHGLGDGGRVAFDGVGTVDRGAALQTAPAYNMGSLSASEGEK